MVVVNHLNCGLAAGDRFAGAGKVMLRGISGFLARSYRPLNGLLETAPLRVTKQGLQVACAPVFGAVFVVLHQLFERPPSNGDFFLWHIHPSLSANVSIAPVESPEVEKFGIDAAAFMSASIQS